MSEEKAKWILQVEDLTQKAAASEGCIMYDLEFVGIGAGRTLRVYIDKADGIVSIDDCSNVSKNLNQQLDENDVVPGGPYHLEVSTPGLDRHLKLPWHFAKVVGKKIWLKTAQPLEVYGNQDKKWKNAKTVEQVLTAVDDLGLRFLVDEVQINVPFQAIEKAKLVFEMVKGQKK
ncbi:MAG: ribosome maturation factor RimP [Pseudobdellovibrionaceae bacterium]